MIDTHTHLYSKQFNDDRYESIDRAIEKGVSKFIIPNVDKASYPLMMEICEKYKGVCFPALGLHPTSVEKDYAAQLSFFEGELEKQSFKAIGEIGIDCYWSLDLIEEQKLAFAAQVEWAKKYNLPIIIHARESFAEIFPILDKLHNEKCFGVFHSFAGTYADYEKIKTYGNFKIGVGGIVTFKNSGLDKVIARMDINDLVLETDSPYLAPHPFRGKRNESAFVVKVAEKIAELKKLPLNEVDSITTKNAEALFNI